MYILIPFCRKCGWLCILHEEFCEKDKFAYHIVDILRNLLFFMVYLLWTVLCLDSVEWNGGMEYWNRIMERWNEHAHDVIDKNVIFNLALNCLWSLASYSYYCSQVTEAGRGIAECLIVVTDSEIDGHKH